MEKIKAGIFDVGGVLRPDPIKAVKQDIISLLDLSQEQFELAWENAYQQLSRGQIAENEFWKIFVTTGNITRSLPIESLLLRQHKLLMHADQDVATIVFGLKNHGYKLGILSNNIEPHVTYDRKQGVYKDFPIQIFSNEVGMKKPDPEIFSLALQKLEVEPEHVFYVDDKSHNVETANSLGMHGIVFENAQKLKNQLSTLGVTLYE